MEDVATFVGEAIGRLAASVEDRGSAFRNLALATVSAEGLPRCRTVILRHVDADPLTLALFTDTRAGKMADIASHPRVSLLAWSEADRLQVRMEGRATVHGPGCDVARGFWQRLPAHGRASYGLDASPGSAVAAPERPKALPEAERASFFAVVTVVADRIDVLRLGPHGAQTRAVRDGNGFQWVAP